MARTAGIFGDRGLTYAGRMGYVRAAEGTLAADSSTLTDANIDPTLAVNCQGLDSIFLSLECDGATGVTVDVEPLFRDDDAADAERWKRIALGSRDGVTLAAAANQKLTVGELAMVEFRVFGWGKVYFRVDAVSAASGTAWRLLAMPGKRRG